MSNYHWVCFRCHEAIRRHGSAENVRCPKCGRPCDNIGYKTPVPPKSKPRLWEELAASYAEARQCYFDRRSAQYVRRIHDLEREIERIECMEGNHGRLELIKELNTKLASERQQHEELQTQKDFYLHGLLPPKAKAASKAHEA
jgi:hypothetical protein